MGLSDVLARAAMTRCHVFLAEVLDGAAPRMAVERELVSRGWVEALSPADADILCVCGNVPDGQTEAIDRIWDQLPGPRARVNVEQPDDAGARFDGCVAELLDTAAQRRREADRKVQPDDDGDDGDGDMDHSDMDHGDSGGMDHSQMDHSGMDHGGMDMPMPGGIPLAGEGTDRDGLNLDVLKVPLGPYLPLWPAGMVLHCELQGDVVFGSTIDFPFGTPEPGPVSDPDERASLVHQLDLAERLLRLAGAAASGTRTRRIRDAALDGAALDQCRSRVQAELVKVRKNWLLQRTLRGLGHIPSGSGIPALEGTDVWARLLGMFEAAAAGAGHRHRTTRRRRSAQAAPGPRPWPGAHRRAPDRRQLRPDTRGAESRGPRMNGSLVEQLPAWGAVAALAVLLLVALSGAAADGLLTARAEGRRGGSLAPVAETARLLRQRPRGTVAADTLLRKVGVVGLPIAAALKIAVLPVGAWVVSDLAVGLVWFNTMDVMVWALVWLAGWGPNSVQSLVGGYRFLALALAYELPLMFALTAPAVAAGSLRMADIVAAQDGLWFVVWMPVAFLVFCAAVLAFSLQRPFTAPLSPDIAGGVLAELSGVERLLLLAGRYMLLAAGAGFGVALFLGGGAGPVLPGWAWFLVKTLVLLGLLLAVRRRVPALRPEQLMAPAWVVGLPLVLLQVLVVAVVAVVGKG